MKQLISAKSPPKFTMPLLPAEILPAKLQTQPCEQSASSPSLLPAAQLPVKPPPLVVGTMAEVSALSSPCAASRQPSPREGAKLPHPPTVIAFAVVASRCPASRQAPPRVVGIPAVSGLTSRCGASCQVPPRESANTAPAAVSKSASAATTIALLAVATPVVAQPKAPRRTAPNAHAIAEKSEAPTTAEKFASLHVHT